MYVYLSLIFMVRIIVSLLHHYSIIVGALSRKGSARLFHPLNRFFADPNFHDFERVGRGEFV